MNIPEDIIINSKKIEKKENINKSIIKKVEEKNNDENFMPKKINEGEIINE